MPPGPDGLPVLGSMLRYGLDPFEYRKEWAEEYGDIVYVDGGLGRDGYILTEPRHFEQVLVNDDEHYRRPREYQEIFRNGLGASEGEFWRKQRELIQPAFYPDQIRSYADDMLTATRELIDRWEGDGEIRDIEAEMKGLTLDVFARSVFGIDGIDEYPEIREACEAISDKASASNQAFPSWFPTAANRRYDRAESKMDGALDKIIDERRGASDDSLLSTLLEAQSDDGHQMSDSTLRDEMVSLLFAGHETTALSLTYTWYLLSKNEEERRRLFIEADDVLDGGFGPQAAMQLEYTDKLVKESLRRLCPAHSLFRQPCREVTIDSYTIPEDSAIFLPIWLLHHDETYFEDPMSFRPDRWDGTLQEQLPKYAYIPFGAGPHRCIGERFAKMELHTIVPMIAREFELEYVGEEPLEFKASLTAEPKNEMSMRVRSR